MFWLYAVVPSSIFILYISLFSDMREPCIFCNIANNVDGTEKLYDDDEICVFRDIKPASDFHVLVIPKRHIQDARTLVPANKDLVEKMLSVAKELILKQNYTLADARFGYHWPPFRSVKHLHLHAIAPVSNMNFIGRVVFWPESFWFVSTEYVLSRLEETAE